MSWSKLKLGELTRIRTGKLDANAADEDGIYPFFTCAVEPLLINIPAFDCKAVLVAGNGDLNVKYHEGKFNAYQRTYVIESIDTNKLHPKFLYYFLSDYIVELRELSIGGVIKYIKLGNLTDAKIPLPPLAEQKRIAAILDKANEIKAKRELAIKLTEKIINDLFRHKFGDPAVNNNISKIMTLDEICNTKGEYGANVSAVDYTDNLPRYIRITDIDDLGNLSDKKVSPNGTEEDWGKYKLNEGDLLFARTGATVGKTYLHNKSESNYVYAGYLIRFRPKVEIADSNYLFAFTKTTFYKQWVLKSQNVVAQPNINAKQYGSELKIPIPPLELQKNFSSQLNKIYQHLNYLKYQKERFENLISSLQHQAFTTGFNS